MANNKKRDEYKKQCRNCYRRYNSNYRNSNPCPKCGSHRVVITHVNGAVDDSWRRGNKREKEQEIEQSPASQPKPVIERTVVERWKGDVYQANSINNQPLDRCREGLNSLIKKRDEINKQIKAARYRLAWHAKRKAKGAFE